MDIIRSIQVDFTIMKEPRGFLRIIQLVLAIFAFATICTSATATIKVTCDADNKTTAIPIKYSYPFSLSDSTVPTPFCSSEQEDKSPFGNISFAPAAQFFCFIGVMSFLLCIAYCIVYIIFSSLFVNDSRAATADFVFSAVWTALWFIASTAWADRLTNMGTALKPQTILLDMKQGDLYCGSLNVRVRDCAPGEGGSHATLVVSVLFGFLNMLVWGAGLWFLYKETKWHKEQASDTERFDQPHAPAAAGGGGASSGAADSSYQSDPNSGAPTY